MNSPMKAQEAVCPACNERRSRAYGPKNNHPLLRCLACGTIFAAIEEEQADLRELYDGYYEMADFGLPPAAAASLERLVQTCEEYRLTGRWFDIGYGEGGLLRIAEARGWKCYGSELSPQSLDFGRRRGWTVASEPERDARFEADGFDVVTMIEFIEHSTDPRKMLRLAARLLRPGGLLYLTTPNAGSLNRRLLGIDWSVIAPPEHVTIWSGSGMRRALAAAGFTVRRMRTEGLNPGEVIFRLRSAKQAAEPGASAGPSRNDVAFALNQAMTASVGRRALKRTINSALSVFRIGDSLKVWAVKGTVMR